MDSFVGSFGELSNVTNSNSVAATSSFKAALKFCFTKLSLEVRLVATHYEDISSLRATTERVYFVGGSPTAPPALVELDPASGQTTTLKLSSTQDVEAYRNYLSVPQPVTFETDNGQLAHGLFYPPQNTDFAAPAGELPPLLVHCHGGPTAAASATLSWGTQYWTSRGFAVFDVNYGGSTGYGREYRLRLQGNWGVVDVADCVNGARYLAETGRVDAGRWAISGASAGGYTTLAALTFREEFQTGASYYGISDLEALAKDTHKFESRYLDGLIGPYPQRKHLYVARSPIHSAQLLAVPVAFFQGAEDRVVPPQQAEEMVEALRRRHIPFPRRQHQAGARCGTLFLCDFPDRSAAGIPCLVTTNSDAEQLVERSAEPFEVPVPRQPVVAAFDQGDHDVAACEALGER